ncbi:MAG: isochorismate synthase [Actinobacteria bacterium]|nr:isochorismate synthase [Actinomycetota bacterium]
MALQVRSFFAPALPPENPDLVFLRNGIEFYGEGIALRLSATGPDRIASLSRQFAEVAESATVQDEVKLSGSGLFGFVSITFSEHSSFESVVVIPARLTVIRDGVSFITEVSGEIEEQVRKTPSGVFFQGDQSATGFLNATNQAIAKIQASELEKVVIARDLVMPLTGEPDLKPAIARLYKRYPHCWTYLVEGNFGASPELLLRAESGEVSARVLAGTAGRGTDPDVDRAIAEGLKHSTKNQHEHQFAVQSLKDTLSSVCENLETDAEPFSLALPDLWHLATDVRGRLKPGVTLLDAVALLHPTAAVAGTPRNLAQQLIEQLEPFDRGGYAGPIGWITSDGSGELAIALRGGRIEREPQLQIRAFAGCGIVAESEPEAELAETELKFKAVRYAFEN